MEGIQTHAAACVDVGENVVYVEDTPGREAGGMDRGLIDLRLGFAGTDAAGKNARGEVTQEREVGQLIFDVKGIGVGEKDEAAAAREFREKAIGEDLMG